MENRSKNIISNYLQKIPRIDFPEEAQKHKEDVFLLPHRFEYSIDGNSNLRLLNFKKTKDYKAQDIIRIVSIIDPLNAIYEETNIITPSVFMHSLEPVPWHISTQSLVFSFLSDEIRQWIGIEEMQNNHTCYHRHPLDTLWLPCSKSIDSVDANEPVCVFNRRISGWDGSLDRPVIELLGAGGHLQSIWNGKRFVSRSAKNNLCKEFKEEVGIDIDEESHRFVGGYINYETHELVILFLTFIEDSLIPLMQAYSLQNHDDDVAGLYLGTFRETIQYYLSSPTFFAGGEKALSTNFPQNKEIMKRIYDLINNAGAK